MNSSKASVADGPAVRSPQEALPDDDHIIAAQKPAVVETPAGPLYAAWQKVYPRKVSGTYRRIKWVLLIVCLGLYYIAPWIRWDRGPYAPSQALLVDIVNRRAYFFWIEIWPQEVYYLTGILIVSALALFLATSLFGRVWCGYACPQTVWTDLFLLVERWIEGDRNARMKFDAEPMSMAKLAKKAIKHGLWIVIAAFTGGAWVMYFSDAPTLIREVFTLEASVGTYFFIGLFTGTTYLLAGMAREQVCTYMCPWPRIQAAMQDEHTLAVTYQVWRGEPRGKHKANETWDGRGDCVDCKGCIAVCPTGIDIRDGQQLECIGCGLCADACDEVMARVGRPKGLISFISVDNLAERAAGIPLKYRFFRTRTLVYGGMLLLVGTVMVLGLSMRSTVDFKVLRERSPLFVTLSDGSVRNTFTVKMLNKGRDERHFRLGAEGLPAGAVVVFGADLGIGGETDAKTGDKSDLGFAVRPDTVGNFKVFVRVPRAALKSASSDFRFIVADEQGQSVASYQTSFAGPGQ